MNETRFFAPLRMTRAVCYAAWLNYVNRNRAVAAAPVRCYYSGAGRFRASLNLRALRVFAVNLRTGETRPMMDENAGLPQALGDGLTLRWATEADIEVVAAHNARHLSDNPDEPEQGLLSWTRDLMGGGHPTTRAGDFTVVVDERAGGRIVSSLCVIPQTWAYGGIPFQVGRPELVSTDPAYRGRGLVRAQFAAIHARGAARGELMQVIDGLAWYYRQFGYEMALAMGGSRRWLPFRIPAPTPDAPPPYRLRPATPADIPLLSRLYAVHCA